MSKLEDLIWRTTIGGDLKSKKSSPEQIKRRMQNSLPWRVSRWLSRVLRGKK